MAWLLMMPWFLSDRLLAEVAAYRAAGGTQRELCYWMGIREVQFSKWLHRNGKNHPHGPDDPRIKRLAAYLELPPETCVEWQEAGDP